MSLNVYRKLEDIPPNMKYIKCNDMYFDSEFIKLNNGNILWENPILIYDGDELCL